MDLDELSEATAQHHKARETTLSPFPAAAIPVKSLGEVSSSDEVGGIL